MVKGVELSEGKGLCVPHVLHALQALVMVVFIRGSGVTVGGLEAIVVGFVVVVLVNSNWAHINVGFFTLEGAKHPISSFLDLLFLWDLLRFSPVLFVGAFFLVYWVEAQETGKKRLIFPLCSSINASIFLHSEGKGFTCLLQWLQVVD